MRKQHFHSAISLSDGSGIYRSYFKEKWAGLSIKITSRQWIFLFRGGLSVSSLKRAVISKVLVGKEWWAYNLQNFADICIDKLVQEWRNSNALAKELRLYCINPLVCINIYTYCLIWYLWHYGHNQIIMVVADDLAPSWRQDISNHHDDECQSLHITEVSKCNVIIILAYYYPCQIIQVAINLPSIL